MQSYGTPERIVLQNWDNCVACAYVIGEDDFIIASSPTTSDSGIIKIFADFLSFCIFLPGNFGHAAFIVRLFIFVFLSETGMWHIYDVLGWGGWIHNSMLWALVALTWGYTGLYAYGVE